MSWSQNNNRVPARDVDGKDFDTSRYPGYCVWVNVYDLGESATLQRTNTISKMFGAGVYHAGVEVFGTEWSYGCMRSPGTGVFNCKPRTAVGHTYRSTTKMGFTKLAQPQVTRLLDKLSAEWPGLDYHLINKNCLHFCNVFSQQLGVGRIPAWVDRVGRTAAQVCKAATLLPLTRGASRAPSPGADVKRVAGTRQELETCTLEARSGSSESPKFSTDSKARSFFSQKAREAPEVPNPNAAGPRLSASGRVSTLGKSGRAGDTAKPSLDCEAAKASGRRGPKAAEVVAAAGTAKVAAPDSVRAEATGRRVPRAETVTAMTDTRGMGACGTGGAPTATRLRSGSVSSGTSAETASPTLSARSGTGRRLRGQSAGTLPETCKPVVLERGATRAADTHGISACGIDAAGTTTRRRSLSASSGTSGETASPTPSSRSGASRRPRGQGAGTLADNCKPAALECGPMKVAEPTGQTARAATARRRSESAVAGALGQAVVQAGPPVTPSPTAAAGTAAAVGAAARRPAAGGAAAAQRGVGRTAGARSPSVGSRSTPRLAGSLPLPSSGQALQVPESKSVTKMLWDDVSTAATACSSSKTMSVLTMPLAAAPVLVSL